MTLADLGAEVWKVERPGEGDDTRSWKPPAAGDTSTYFLAANRNKFGLAIDFQSEAGRRLVRDLACKADVLVENYLAGTLDRYGLTARLLLDLGLRSGGRIAAAGRLRFRDSSRERANVDQRRSGR